MTHEYDAIIVIKEGEGMKSVPALQVKIKFCTCGGTMKEDSRIHSTMEMYEFVVYNVQNVINNYKSCYLAALLISLTTALPLQKIQHHIWCVTSPEGPADARYNMYVEVYSDCSDLYPTIRMADFDVPLEKEDLVDMFKQMGAQVYLLDENGTRRI